MCTPRLRRLAATLAVFITFTVPVSLFMLFVYSVITAESRPTPSTPDTIEATHAAPTISLDLRQSQMTATSAAGDTLLTSATTTTKGWEPGSSGTVEPGQSLHTAACESRWVIPLGFDVEGKPAALGHGCTDSDFASSMALISIPKADLLGLRVSGEPFEVTVTAVKP